MNWLGDQGHFSLLTLQPAKPGAMDMDSLAYMDGKRVKLFTIHAQWVYGTDLREAVDIARHLPTRAVP